MMLRPVLLSLSILSLAVPLAGCGAGASMRSGGERFGAGVGEAAGQPLEDFNLRRDDIPMVLRQAVDRPYDLYAVRRCPDISVEVARLDAALGPDIDRPIRPVDPDRGVQAAGVALDVVRDVATDFIPLRSWVRRLTGAQQHSEAVQSAIRAGVARRAFLKGTGQQWNCAPPAAPHDYLPR